MPVDFLSDDQVTAYGRFVGPVSPLDLERFFFLDDDDVASIGRRRGDGNRLGFGVQLGPLRFLGVFLEDPASVPATVVDFIATQLGIVDLSVWESYSARTKTAYEHGWEIAQTYGYRRLSESAVADEFVSFLTARARTRTERPSALFDQGVGWLRRERVLLPGVSVLTRLVAEVRSAASEQLYSLLAGRVSVPLAQRLDGLLEVRPDARTSELERLRRAPVRGLWTRDGSGAGPRGRDCCGWSGRRCGAGDSAGAY